MLALSFASPSLDFTSPELTNTTEDGRMLPFSCTRESAMDSGDGMLMNKYSKYHFEALGLYESGLFEESIEVAGYNLTHPTLPRYLQMKNLIWIIGVLDDWDEADRYLQQAEAI